MTNGVDRINVKKTPMSGMSYIEHGPRIFMASKPNVGMPLIYGDYVLPRKRSEGRLKLQESCTDVRAWSPNSLENTRYFRELAEHASPKGEKIPFNVIIENIIGRTSQAQNELQFVRRELRKYKSLELTPEQEEQLRNLDSINHGQRIGAMPNNQRTILSSKDTVINTNRSVSPINSESYLSILIRPRLESQNNKSLLYSYSPNSTCNTDPFTNNTNLLPVECTHETSTEEDNEKTKQCVQYVDVALQVELEMREIGVQFESPINAYILNRVTIASAASQTSLIYKSSEDSESDTEGEKNSSQSSDLERRSFEYNLSYTENSEDDESHSGSESEIRTERDLKMQENAHKGVIIEKDSEIIVLKNELCVKEADLEELREMNKNLETLLKEKDGTLKALQENFKIVHDKLIRLEVQYNYESEDLKKKLCAYKCLVEQLKDDLNKSSQACHLQSLEIEKLQSFANEVAALRNERDSLLKKVKDVEVLSKEAENCSLAVKQLKDALREKDELKKQNREQSCVLADQEDEIKRLLILISQMSIKHERQTKTEQVLKELKERIQDKEYTISRYEERVHSMKREISEFFHNLKNCFLSLDEFDESQENTRECVQYEFDIREEANHLFHNVNLLMTRFQSYKIERANLLQQIETLKHFSRDNAQQVSLNHSQNISSVSSDEYFDYESDLGREVPVGRSNVIVLSVRQNKSVNTQDTHTCEVENDNPSSSPNSEQSINEITNNLSIYRFEKDCCRRNAALYIKTSMYEIEKEIIQQISDSLLKMKSLMKELQPYMEIERPSLIKQIQHCYDILKNAELIVTCSEDISLRKQRISDLYDRCQDKNVDAEDIPNDIRDMQLKVNQCIKTIIYQQSEDMLRLERINLQDQKIDEVLKLHLTSCINRINSTLRGAGDQRVEIVKEITKQQQEIKKKDIEIVRLREEVARHIAQRGEGDCLNRLQSEKNKLMENELLKVTAELCEKDKLVSKLQEEVQMIENKLSSCNRDCNALKKQNKNLENIKNRLSKERQENAKVLIMKNKEITQLSQELRDMHRTKDFLSVMESNIKEMEKKLFSLQNENDALRSKIVQTDEMIFRKEENIMNLKGSLRKNENILIHKIREHDAAIEAKTIEITQLKNENEMLNDKLKPLEDTVARMNATILSLTEENDKINTIYILQEDLASLDKNEKKLKLELNDLRTRLVYDQNTNRTLENKLDNIQRENEHLKEVVQYWKNENSDISIKICDEITDRNSREILQTIPNKIYEKISTFKQQLIVHSPSCDQFMHLQREMDIRTIKSEMEHDRLPTSEEDVINETIDGTLTVESKFQENESTVNQINKTHENEIDTIYDEKQDSKISKDSFVSSNKSKGLTDISKLRYTLKHIENENQRKQDEIKKLMQDVESRDTEIKSLKETINCLMQEKSNLHAMLKYQLEEYQDKLMLMKKNYDSSLNALCERHKESVERLQTRFEDTVTGETMNFDLESWLHSLSSKELMQLHERICMFDSCVIANNELQETHINENTGYSNQNVNAQGDPCVDINDEKLHSSTNAYENDEKPIPDLCCKQEIPDKISSPHNQRLPTRDENQVPENLISQLRECKLNEKQNLGFSKAEYKHPELTSKSKSGREALESDNLDKQRWNFINQCSMYHKLSNLY